MRVLIVEDEQAAREGLVDIIDWGALGIDEIYTAPNGHRGLMEAKKHRPDILLTDIRMPVMDGIRMAGEIVKLYPECSILFLTAYAEIGYYREAIKLKAVSYVEKPVTPGQLKEAVARAVVEHRNRTSVQKLLKEQDRERVSRAAACLLREGMTRGQEQELIRLLGITKEAAAWGTAFLVQAEGGPELWERMAACLEEEAEAAQMRLACVKKDAGITVFFLLGRFAPSGATRELFCDKIAGILGPCARYGIAVGESVEGLRRVFASYQTAACLLQLGFYEPRGRVMLPRDGAAGPGGRRYTGEKSQILGAIDSLDRSRTEALEEELYRVLTAKRDAFPEHVRELYAAFFFSLDRQRELKYGQDREKPKQWDKVPAMNLEELHRVYREMAGELFADRGEGGQEQPTVRMIKNYIRENCGNPALSLKDISDYVHISGSHMCMLFKKETGTTVNQYVTEVRMERALRLLKEGRLGVGRICELSGYKDSSYFGRAFRKKFGMTPLEYREKWMTEKG